MISRTSNFNIYFFIVMLCHYPVRFNKSITFIASISFMVPPEVHLVHELAVGGGSGGGNGRGGGGDSGYVKVR